MLWLKGIAAKVGAEKMTQLMDRIWCRLFHKRYHVQQEQVHGWRFWHCNKCKITWPQRALSEETASS